MKKEGRKKGRIIQHKSGRYNVAELDEVIYLNPVRKKEDKSQEAI